MGVLFFWDLNCKEQYSSLTSHKLKLNYLIFLSFPITSGKFENFKRKKKNDSEFFKIGKRKAVTIQNDTIIFV